jgi:hypothetical protein
VLSKDILTGHVGWWTHRAKWGKGRLMVSQPQSGLARSFSCGNCLSLCTQALLSPNSSLSFGIGGIGPLGDVSANACLGLCGSCGGTPSGPYSGFSIRWSSSNTSIATLSSGQYLPSANFQGVAPGATNGNVVVSDQGCTARGGGPITVEPLISGPTTLWWFNGLSLGVSGYSNQITLTASPTAGTYSWAVTAGSDKVSLNNSTSSSVVVTSTGQSKTANDVSVTATTNGQTSAPFQLTVRAPYALSSDPNHPTPVYTTDPNYVWDTDIYYLVVDNFLTPVPVSLPINEYFTTGPINDYSGTNWRQGSPGCAQTAGAEFFDLLGGENSSRVPTPVYSPNWTGAKVQHWGQDWHVGTCNLGSGPRVQSDTIQKWTDHALHTNIVSPNP